MVKATEDHAMQVLQLVAAWLGKKGMTEDGSPAPTGNDAACSATGPMLNMEWDWPSDGPTPTILLEGGPYDWAIEICDDIRDAVSQINPGLWVEPYAGYALCVIQEEIRIVPGLNPAPYVGSDDRKPIKRKVKIEFETTPRLLADILITAAEGVNSWWLVTAYRHDYQTGRDVEDVMMMIVDVEVEDCEFKVTLDTIHKGIKRIITEDLVCAQIRKDIVLAITEDDASSIDSNDADCIVQVGLFGKLVYC